MTDIENNPPTPPPQESELPQPTVPTLVDRYRLVFELASGGMATVYLARTEGGSGINKLVALKRIHPHLAKETNYIDMFLDEAHIASRITHANVCSVFDSGESNGEYYMAMEYLVGEPLARLYRHIVDKPEHRHTPQLAFKMARIVADACEGLHAAHELKDDKGELLHVVHRDVSPRNLFVTYAGVVQVVDFGIASARERLHQTATGDLKGTFAYMAPEQMISAHADRRADVWALGVVLWELLALKRLFKGESNANTMYAVLHEDIQPPSMQQPHVPEELDEIALKALQREPNERWQTAREMGQALRQVLAKHEAMIGPPELSEWMAEVFPEGEARKRLLMDIARTTQSILPSRPPSELFDEPSESLSITEFALPTPKTGSATRRLWLLLGSFLVLAALIGVVAYSTRKSPTENVAEPKPLAIPTQPPAPTFDAPPKETKPIAPTPDAKPSAALKRKRKPANKPRKKAVRPKAAPVGTGGIRVVTQGGWGMIYKNGKSLGKTPARFELPAGKHKLTLKPFGTGQAIPIYVNVVPNATKTISFTIE